ncbi:MAG TPA: DEAD/DEAH box helicase, partial [Planctomycetota bacterium]|nr:DEAD/DEAH box helicase [Planctomycetota bacterium]
KLRDQNGERTVAVEAFEGRNLVLVDEGHRGASSGKGGAWMRHRDTLCDQGFSFEYSATFAQAVEDDPELDDVYARGILFDYSYRHFHGDGFGKDFHILNLEDDRDPEFLERYLTVCLLSFFEQLRVFRESEIALRPFGIERPLWVFVGGSVTATRGTAADVVAILTFLARYVAQPERSIRRIRQILRDGLRTASGEDLTNGRFVHLREAGLDASGVFAETLATIFNAPAGGKLRVENRKGAPGELALRVADDEPFGVVSVGDEAKLAKVCAASDVEVVEKAFGGALFDALDAPASTVSVLIGSRKFNEGWSSWRVSTMGLMRFGMRDGAQVLQLFGRGVRLKGYGMSLKRSARARLPEGLVRPAHLEALETLNVFGIRADAMARFRELLENEGIDLAPRSRTDEPCAPIGGACDSAKKASSEPCLAGADSLSRFVLESEMSRLRPLTIRPPSALPDPAADVFRKRPVTLEWHPRIRVWSSTARDNATRRIELSQAELTEGHIAFLDVDRLELELERFRIERGWRHVVIPRRTIERLLADPSWYRLFIPKAELAFDSLEKTRTWQEIALALLRTYVARVVERWREADDGDGAARR